MQLVPLQPKTEKWRGGFGPRLSGIVRALVIVLSLEFGCEVLFLYLFDFIYNMYITGIIAANYYTVSITHR